MHERVQCTVRNDGILEIYTVYKGGGGGGPGNAETMLATPLDITP